MEEAGSLKRDRLYCFPYCTKNRITFFFCRNSEVSMNTKVFMAAIDLPIIAVYCASQSPMLLARKKIW